MEQCWRDSTSGLRPPAWRLCPLPSRKVNREADGQSDQNVADKNNDMLEVADDQGVVGRNEEEVDDKIGGEGGRQRSPHRQPPRPPRQA